MTPSWIIDHGGKKYLYYVGWNQGSTVRMAEMAGLAVSTDGGEQFTRVSRAPILERTDREPLSLLAATCVRIENGIWRMWYVSGIEWVHRDFVKYDIKYAESDDGIRWKRDGKPCLGFKSPEEYAVARPCVLKEGGLYKMWFAYRHGQETYRIGYAESVDGRELGSEGSMSGDWTFRRRDGIRRWSSTPMCSITRERDIYSITATATEKTDSGMPSGPIKGRLR